MNPQTPLLQSFWQNFLGNAPKWYKRCILAILLLNPLLLLLTNGFVMGWLILLEFVFTLAMALRCYPLQSGGLIALEGFFLGLTSSNALYREVIANFPVILLLMFMVAGVYFMRDLLMFIFTKLLVRIKSQMLLAFLFSFMAALLSAFLDALTLIAVVIAIGSGFYSIYCRAIAEIAPGIANAQLGEHVPESHQEDLTHFRTFLRGLLMHAAIGTALGGVCTIVGEPQNLLIGKAAGWNFMEFAIQMAPVTLPVLLVGLLTCILLEHFRYFGYGQRMPASVRAVLESFDRKESENRTTEDRIKLIVQGLAAVTLVVSLSLHIAEVGFIGLMIIILQTALNGTIEEHKLGHAFEEALPFTALLVVFFGVVSIIHEQHLFQPLIAWVVSFPEAVQPSLLYMANGVLSAISDNVFVATIYISEIQTAFSTNMISRELFDQLAVAINTGTNIPSVATPNGQAALLFLLTSSLAPMIQLSYGRMVWMALPYTITITITGLIAVALFI